MYIYIVSSFFPLFLFIFIFTHVRVEPLRVKGLEVGAEGIDARQHARELALHLHQHTSAYISIRQHASAKVSAHVSNGQSMPGSMRANLRSVDISMRANLRSIYISMRANLLSLHQHARPLAVLHQSMRANLLSPTCCLASEHAVTNWLSRTC